MSKNVKRIFAALLTVISVFSVYCVLAVNFLVSDEYTVIDGGSIDFSLPYFITTEKDSAMSAGTSGKLSDGVVTTGEYKKDMTLKVLNIIPVKTVSVNVVKSPQIVPSGECIGVKIFCDGLVTVGVSDFEKANGGKASPARDAGIKSGDIIKEINGKKILKISEFTEMLDNSQGECEIKLLRNDEERSISITPEKCTDGHKRLGIWVRDSIAGIGTMTFQKKDTGSFAALGHGISDSDADVLMPLSSGKIYKASVLGITKGEKGIPGEIIGALNESEQIGECTKNAEAGIYGKTNISLDDKSAVDIAPGSDVQKGEATVICTVDESGPKAYSLEIVNINRLAGGGTKSMVIQVTDRRLIEKTGGIIQGMSGSPIIQNGKLIGAVTHVFVNNPLKGYAIFAETMLENVE